MRPSPTPFPFFNDPRVLSSTPVEEGEGGGLPRAAFVRIHVLYRHRVTVLRPGRFNPKNGFTLDTESVATDFAVLVSALRHVLYPVSFPEFSKLLDLEHNYDFYHVVPNEIIFTVLPIRLRYEVEKVPNSDTDRFWVQMRAAILSETEDPAPQLTTIRTMGDKHARINTDHSMAKRVKDLWHILTNSAKHTPFVTPLYITVIRELRGGTPFSFSTLCLRIRTVWREEHAFATPVTDTGSSPPPGGGGERMKKPTLNAVYVDRNPAYTTKPGW
ncbi:hypothetical protein CYMTET_4269 [Cymbomonas tetramitiformis]|uniref:Uncharacterized protein n=1 Tax=Cymbomonas tetramitiformis TaxID=36881 RepID=A0AAE0H1I0_9CHLO|nr:hypothetical protein CYMTET_4269 [Cymbomonas tetramitiformis]